MAKIVIEIPEELKQEFKVVVLENKSTQRIILTQLIEKWLKRKRGK